MQHALKLPIGEPQLLKSPLFLQVRDEYRVDFDEGRGGYGNIVKAQLSDRQQDMLHQMREYEAGQDDARGSGDEAEEPHTGGPANPRFREEHSDDE